jgi:hypothetical protein
MYKIETITSTTHPKEWALIKEAFPGYRKRRANLVRVESVTLSGRYWDGGSISRYCVVTGGVTFKHIPQRSDFPFTAPDIEVELNGDTVVIQWGIFCGKPSQAYLYKC